MTNDVTTARGAIRHVTDTGHVEYVISESDLKRAMRVEDHGFIFDVQFDAGNRELHVSMEPRGN